jgi:hypothetical protein
MWGDRFWFCRPEAPEYQVVPSSGLGGIHQCVGTLKHGFKRWAGLLEPRHAHAGPGWRKVFQCKADHGKDLLGGCYCGRTVELGKDDHELITAESGHKITVSGSRSSYRKYQRNRAQGKMAYRQPGHADFISYDSNTDS